MPGPAANLQITHIFQGPYPNASGDAVFLILMDDESAWHYWGDGEWLRSNFPASHWLTEYLIPAVEFVDIGL